MLLHDLLIAPLGSMQMQAPGAQDTQPFLWR